MSEGKCPECGTVDGWALWNDFDIEDPPMHYEEWHCEVCGAWEDYSWEV